MRTLKLAVLTLLSLSALNAHSTRPSSVKISGGAGPDGYKLIGGSGRVGLSSSLQMRGGFSRSDDDFSDPSLNANLGLSWRENPFAFQVKAVASKINKNESSLGADTNFDWSINRDLGLGFFLMPTGYRNKASKDRGSHLEFGSALHYALFRALFINLDASAGSLLRDEGQVVSAQNVTQHRLGADIDYEIVESFLVFGGISRTKYFFNGDIKWLGSYGLSWSFLDSLNLDLSGDSDKIFKASLEAIL